MTLHARPCTPLEARDRLRALVGVGGQYALGTGDYHPEQVAGGILDVPWTQRKDGIVGGDCVIVIVYGYKLTRHRPGFARGHLDPAFEDDLDVDDDINTNAAIEDARTEGDLFALVPIGEPLQSGDLIMYPTIRLRDPKTGEWMRHEDGELMKWIGHVVFVDDPRGVVSGGPYTPARIIQCHGPDKRSPGLVYTDGSGMDHHDTIWPREAHRAVAVRVKP